MTLPVDIKCFIGEIAFAKATGHVYTNPDIFETVYIFTSIDLSSIKKTSESAHRNRSLRVCEAPFT